MKNLVSTYPLCWSKKSVPLVYHPNVPPIPSVKRRICVHPLCKVLTISKPSWKERRSWGGVKVLIEIE